MKLYKEMLVKLLEKEEVQVTFPNLNMDVEKLLEMECYNTLQKIRAILADDSLSDRECFLKIEEMVWLFEKLGGSCGSRHDF